jgi:hypothetical protein
MDPIATMQQLFAEKSVAEQQALLATLERAGAALYRGWADSEHDPKRKAALLAAAAREEENARVLEAKQ